MRVGALGPINHAPHPEPEPHIVNHFTAASCRVRGNVKSQAALMHENDLRGSDGGGMVNGHGEDIKATGYRNNIPDFGVCLHSRAISWRSCETTLIERRLYSAGRPICS